MSYTQPNESTDQVSVESLMEARLVLITNLTKTSPSYKNFSEVERFTNEQLDKIDDLIESLALQKDEKATKLEREAS